jgi:hypothetical protein
MRGRPEPNPPSATTADPVMNEASSLARKTANRPTSSDLPILQRACNFPAARAAVGSGWTSKYPQARPASMYPGQMQFTRMPSLPCSIAMAFVSAMMPPLVAQ